MINTFHVDVQFESRSSFRLPSKTKEGYQSIPPLQRSASPKGLSLSVRYSEASESQTKIPVLDWVGRIGADVFSLVTIDRKDRKSCS